MAFLEQVKERLFYFFSLRLRKIKYRVGISIILNKVCVAGLVLSLRNVIQVESAPSNVVPWCMEKACQKSLLLINWS